MKQVYKDIATFVLGFAFFAALFALLILLTAKVTRTAPDLDQAGGKLGYAECVADGVPLAWVESAAWGTPLELPVKVHEYMHAVQITRYPTCHAWDRAYGAHPEEFEAEAYAAAVLIAPDVLPLSVAANWLAAKYDFDLTDPEAQALIGKYLGPMIARLEEGRK